MFLHCLATFAVLLGGNAVKGQDLPGMAAGILQQTDQARQAIAARDGEAALARVRNAEALAQQIASKVPPKDRPILVTVYKEVDATSTYRPVKPGNGDTPLARRMKKDTSIRSVEGETTTGKLDVTTAADRLKAAESALERHDWTAADNALSAIRNGVVRTAVAANMPLLSARENLTLARNLVLDGRFEDAAAPLRSAAQALADFEKIAPGPRAQDAEYMRQKVEAYARDIKKHHENAAQEIGYWQEEASQWDRELANR